MPGNPHLLTATAQLFRMNGALSSAARACDAAIASDARHVPAWLERGLTFATGGSWRQAADSFRRVIMLDPSVVAAWSGLADIAAAQGDNADAQTCAARALALDPTDAEAICALAKAEIASGNAGPARDRLIALLAADSCADDRVIEVALLGDAHDRLGDTVAAFAAYARSNAAFARQFGPQLAARGESDTGVIAALTARIERAPPPRQPLPAAAVPGAASGHVFLLGHPRSGTTLVENILASLPGVSALEERPTLAAAETAFMVPEAGLIRLAQLSADSARPYQTAYWQKVRACGVPAAATTLVDMDPMKGLHLPLIARLFPAARVVIMLRDPRDVVWSCFRTGFTPSLQAIDFTTLDGAARHYDAVMNLTRHCLETLPLDAHFVRYEALVADFDAETQRLCAFTGAPWTPELRQFDKTAQRRGVSTASAAQLGRGLYNGSGQWRRYAAQMEPVLPILQPWVERFGYGE